MSKTTKKSFSGNTMVSGIDGPTVLPNVTSDIIDKLPLQITPCLVKVMGFEEITNPDEHGYCLAIVANKRVYFPSPYTGEYFPNGLDVTHMVTDVKFG